MLIPVLAALNESQQYSVSNSFYHQAHEHLFTIKTSFENFLVNYYLVVTRKLIFSFCNICFNYLMRKTNLRKSSLQVFRVKRLLVFYAYLSEAVILSHFLSFTKSSNLKVLYVKAVVMYVLMPRRQHLQWSLFLSKNCSPGLTFKLKK